MLVVKWRRPQKIVWEDPKQSPEPQQIHWKLSNFTASHVNDQYWLCRNGKVGLNGLYVSKDTQIFELVLLLPSKYSMRVL